MEEYSKKEVQKLEAEKEAKVKEITLKHNKKYREIKNYFNDITATSLGSIKQLKSEIQDAQVIEEQDRKLLLKAQEHNKRYSQPLKRIYSEIQKLNKENEDWKRVKLKKEKLRDKIEKLEKQYREIEYQFEIQFQQY